MAFIFEKIPEVTKQEYGFDITKRWWLIDRERDTFLIPTGGAGCGDICFFDLYVDKKVTKIIAEISYSPNKNDSRKEDVKYVVLHSQPISLIKEVLTAYGFNGNPEFTGEVTVEFKSDKHNRAN